jgi:hypothetical protein
MIMKDPIVQEIHRHRTNYAKRFDYDVRAIGEDIRRCEMESKGKFAVKISRPNHRLKRSARKVSPKG